MESLSGLQVIAFDADDTLWGNEHYFREIEEKFCALMEDYHPQHTVSRELLAKEIKNLSLYGYGIKSFMLSMIEAAIEMSGKTIGIDAVEKIIDFGKEMLQKPVELLDGVEQVLAALQKKYRLVMATKGDLLDQERKLIKSGLEKYFHHIEILTEKKEENYSKLIRHLDISPEHFLMVGNSLKSDVLPVLHLGGHAFHIPYYTTWEHEQIKQHIDHPNFKKLENIREILMYI